MSIKKKKEVVIIGGDFSALILALLLSKQNIEVEMYLEEENPTSLVVFNDEEYNLAVSFLHDVEGIVNYVLNRIGIDILSEVEIFNNIEEYILSPTEKVIRKKDIKNFVNYLSQLFIFNKDKIMRFFEIIINLGKENWLSVMKENISLKEIPYFMKYFNVEYKTFVKSFDFDKKLENLLISLAPNDKISLVTMSGYWLQLDSVGRFKRGWKSFYEKLISISKKSFNIFIGELKKIECVSDLWRLSFKDGKEIYSKVVIFSKGRWVLENFGIKLKNYSVLYKLPSKIYFVKFKENKFNKSVAYIRKTIDNSESKIIYSYLNRDIVKAEYISSEDLYFDKEKLEQNFEVIEMFTDSQLQNATGIYKGILSLWAHNVSEIRNNPLQNLKVYKGIYCLGDWGTGYFYAAEFYSRDILKYLKT